jgi:hypothetical protein
MTGRTSHIFASVLLGSLAACQSVPILPPTPAVSEPSVAGTWRATATETDRLRIRRWHSSWVTALADARAKGYGKDIEREGDLLDPMAALPNAFLPAGEYQCRTIKLGALTGTLGYIAYDWFRCQVRGEQGLSSLSKLSGSQRPVGLIFPDNLRRQIFLGTLELGDEQQPVDYGSDRMRDMAGVIERIGEERWRLVLPSPAYESLLDVIELRPAS